MSQHGMSLSGALSTYTILTIGDGLVSQIPALLISISAGFIVTRVNGDSDNMGRKHNVPDIWESFCSHCYISSCLGDRDVARFSVFLFFS